MKITVDTNLLVRAVMRDDPAQARAAARTLTDATLIAIALPSLCELVWLLLRVYKLSSTDVASAIRALTGAANITLNRPAVKAGLAMLDAGGDFADGAIAYEGHWLGGETFVSFDRQAVKLLKAQGKAVRLLAGGR